jgi:hypothetical protein
LTFEQLLLQPHLAIREDRFRALTNEERAVLFAARERIPSRRGRVMPQNTVGAFSPSARGMATIVQGAASFAPNIASPGSQAYTAPTNGQTLMTPHQLQGMPGVDVHSESSFNVGTRSVLSGGSNGGVRDCWDNY